MRKLIYGLRVSPDGYIAGPGDDGPDRARRTADYARRRLARPEVVFSSTLSEVDDIGGATVGGAA